MIGYILFIIILFIIIYIFLKIKNGVGIGGLNELYTSQINRKMNLGPFYIVKSGEKIYIYNPSIELTRDGQIIGVSRMTGRIASECRHEYKDADFQINRGITKEISQYPKEYRPEISSIVFWTLNNENIISNFKILNSFSSLDICNKKESINSSLKSAPLAQGIEDPRLFTFNNELWVYGHYRGKMNDVCIHAPVIFRVNNPSKLIRLHTNDMREIEKNWMPFEYNEELYFEYDISPHIILKCDIITGNCIKIYETESIKSYPITKKHLGGGAPSKLFEINGKKYFLGFAHTRQTYPVIRKNFFYVFTATPPFNIIMIGDEFDVLEGQNKQIEFGSGMVIKNNGNVVIACGISDCYSLLSEIPIEDILKSLHKII